MSICVGNMTLEGLQSRTAYTNETKVSFVKGKMQCNTYTEVIQEDSQKF